MELLKRLWGWACERPSTFWSRWASLLLAMGSFAVLAIAVWLEPNPAGHSTHLQLGLSKCSFYALTDWPCPMCGATTTFALLAHFRLLEGVVNQPFAALLFAMTVTTLVISVLEVVGPRDRWLRLYRRIEPWEASLAIGFLVFMAIGWLYKIISMTIANGY